MDQFKRFVDWCQRPSMIKMHKFQPSNIILIVASFSVLLGSIITATYWLQPFPSYYYPQKPYVSRQERVWNCTTNNEEGFAPVQEIIYRMNLPTSMIPFVTKPFVIKDLARSGLNWISTESTCGYGSPHTPNTEIEYVAETGEITITVKGTRQPDYRITLRFEVATECKFEDGQCPEYTCLPADISYGTETDVEVSISEFKIRDTESLRCADIYVGFTVLAEEYEYLWSEPEAYCPPNGQVTRWSHFHPSPLIGQHKTKYFVKVGSNDSSGQVILRSDITLWYDKPFLLEWERPSFSRGDVEFEDRGSIYEYQYEHGIV